MKMKIELLKMLFINGLRMCYNYVMLTIGFLILLIDFMLKLIISFVRVEDYILSEYKLLVLSSSKYLVWLVNGVGRRRIILGEEIGLFPRLLHFDDLVFIIKICLMVSVVIRKLLKLFKIILNIIAPSVLTVVLLFIFDNIITMMYTGDLNNIFNIIDNYLYEYLDRYLNYNNNLNIPFSISLETLDSLNYMKLSGSTPLNYKYLDYISNALNVVNENVIRNDVVNVVNTNKTNQIINILEILMLLGISSILILIILWYFTLGNKIVRPKYWDMLLDDVCNHKNELLRSEIDELLKMDLGECLPYEFLENFNKIDYKNIDLQALQLKELRIQLQELGIGFGNKNVSVENLDSGELTPKLIPKVLDKELSNKVEVLTNEISNLTIELERVNVEKLELINLRSELDSMISELTLENNRLTEYNGITLKENTELLDLKTQLLSTNAELNNKILEYKEDFSSFTDSINTLNLGNNKLNEDIIGYKERLSQCNLKINSLKVDLESMSLENNKQIELLNNQIDILSLEKGTILFDKDIELSGLKREIESLNELVNSIPDPGTEFTLNVNNLTPIELVSDGRLRLNTNIPSQLGLGSSNGIMERVPLSANPLNTPGRLNFDLQSQELLLTSQSKVIEDLNNEILKGFESLVEKDKIISNYKLIVNNYLENGVVTSDLLNSDLINPELLNRIIDSMASL